MEETRKLIGTTGEELFLRVWLPRGVRRGLVVIAHGLSEHSGRYRHVCSLLADHGLAVYIHDHMGHGQSGGTRGWVARFDDFLDDLEKVHTLAIQENPGLRCFLLGHSMGGLITVAYLLERARKPDYVILSGPAIVPILDPGDRRIDATRLSKDPEVQKAYMEDPLVLRERVTDELFMRLADGLSYLPGRAGELTLPTLLIQGSDDQLCSAEGAELYLRSSGVKDLTVKMYPGGRHEMFNETNKDEVLADLWGWIGPRLG